jgi:hypothetical protein
MTNRLPKLLIDGKTTGFHEEECSYCGKTAFYATFNIDVSACYVACLDCWKNKKDVSL